jgi:hypothetical protein
MIPGTDPKSSEEMEVPSKKVNKFFIERSIVFVSRELLLLNPRSASMTTLLDILDLLDW